MSQPQPPPPMNATASPGADTASINRQIATLLGWTQRYDSTSGCECWKDPANGYCDYVPDYAGDYGEALRLLETCLSNPLVAAITIFQTHGGLWCSRIKIRLSFDGGTWHELATDEAQTLPLAIALSCRDAMLALKGDTDDGTNA